MCIQYIYVGWLVGLSPADGREILWLVGPEFSCSCWKVSGSRSLVVSKKKIEVNCKKYNKKHLVSRQSEKATKTNYNNNKKATSLKGLSHDKGGST